MTQALSIKSTESIMGFIRNHDSELVIKELFRRFVIKDDSVYDLVVQCVLNVGALEKQSRIEKYKLISDFDARSGTYEGWMLCVSLMTQSGNFDLAYLMREKAKAALYREYELQSDNLELAYQVLSLAIEDGNNSLFSEARNKLGEGYCLDKVRRVGLNYIDRMYLFCNGLEIKDFEVEGKINREFFEFVNDKTISLVTPTKVKLEDAKEIDASDIVVRINLSEEGQGCDAINKGLRTDISYYNTATIVKINKEYGGKIPQNLKFVVRKHSREKLDCMCRTLTPFDEALLNGSLNMIPNALFDLLQFSPANIKIFHSDMMLKPSMRVENYYEKGSVLGQDKLFKEWGGKMFSIHDPFGQINLLKRVVNGNKRVTADKILDQVLNMPLIDFSCQLTENYRIETESERNRNANRNVKVDSKSIDFQLKTLDDKIFLQNELLKKQEEIIQRQDLEYSRIKKSLSWKLTKPLRAIFKIARR